MKKILVLLIIVGTSKVGFSQGSSEDELKNFRFGLKGSGIVSWMKPDETVNTFDPNRVSVKANYGLTTLFRLSKIVSFNTGLEVSYIGGNLKLANTKENAYYYVDRSVTPIDTSFQLASRKFSATYLDLPIMLKMQTGEIGLITYFGQFGFNVSTLAPYIRKATAVDYSYVKSNAINKNVDISKDVAFFRFGLEVGGGVEFNLFGTTSAVVGLNYYQGFTNMLKSQSANLIQKKTTTDKSITTTKVESMKQSAKNNFLSLSFGILF